MPLYSLDGNKKLRLIAEQSIRLEADIQIVVETNLNQIFGLQLVAHEFTVQSFTLDTVAFDEETNAFVIIEYKRDEGGSVIDQGYAYLATMLNNKAEFVLEYNKKFGKNLTKKDIDWAESKVLFVAQRFTPHQMAAINFKDIPIELWRFSRFDNSTLSFEQIKPAVAVASIAPLLKSREGKAVQAAVQVETAADFAASLPKTLQRLYEGLEEALKNQLPDLEYKVGKKRLMLKRRWATVCYVTCQREGLRLILRLPKVPQGNSLGKQRAVRESDVFKIQAHVKRPQDMASAIELVKAAYQETGRLLGEAPSRTSI